MPILAYYSCLGFLITTLGCGRIGFDSLSCDSRSGELVCVFDNDGDGVAENDDIDDNDPTVCMDSDFDTCDDCQSGRFDPSNDGSDVDRDGHCDAAPIVLPVYAAQANWNEYVKNDNLGQDIYNQDGVSCVGNEGTGYRGCLHGAELKKASLADETSCAGISASDLLGVFSWICDDSQSAVTLYTVEVNPGRGLGSVIDGDTSSWRTNQLIVEKEGAIIAKSALALWWSNPVIDVTSVADPNVGTPVIELDQSGTIYFFSQSMTTTTGYNLNADRVGLVGLNGSTMTYSGLPSLENCDIATGNPGINQLCLVSIGQQSFAWLEGGFDGAGMVDYTVNFEGNRYSILNNVRTAGGTLSGLSFHQTNDSRIRDTLATGNLGSGIRIHIAGRNRIERAAARNNTLTGISATTSNNNEFVDIESSLNERGINISNSSTSNRYDQVKISSNREHGLYIANAGHDLC